MPENGAISSVISSGNISLIKNDELKYLLNSWPGKINLYKYSTALLQDGVMNDIKPAILKYYPIQNLQMVNTLEDSLSRETSDVSLFEYSQNLIFSDMELANNVELKRIDSENAWTRAIEIRDLQQEILTLVSEELKN